MLKKSINNKKINVITLGCSKNTVDSERLMQQIKLNNGSLSENPNNADVVIINTCGFIEAAKQESIDTILNAVELKKEGKLQQVIVAGCLSERYKEDLIKEIPEVDSFFGVEDYEGIINKLGGRLRYELLGERVLTTPSHTAYLKISEGCDHPCSFCAIPLMRGKNHSRKIEDLVSEAGLIVKSGVKELVIIGQDTTDYGKDIYGKKELGKLLTSLSEIEGIEWIRLMYAYPSQFPEDVIDVIANNEKIVKYIDMPLQHISDNVLKSMRRGITTRATKELLNKFKSKIDDIVIRTTLLTGYPAETEQDFLELVDFIKEFEFDKLGVFTFSQEENTTSFLLGDPIPEEVKEERKSILMEAQREVSAKKNSQLVGKELKVLVERTEGEYFIGRSYRDAPEVDGEVLIEKKGLSLEKGNFYDVKIIDSDEYDLYGTIGG